MSNITRFDDRRPHVVGFEICMACGREWVGVAPLEDPMPRAECPRCGEMRGEMFPDRAAARRAFARARLTPHLRLVKS